MSINTCREIGRDLRDRGRHATEPGHLAPWLNAYSTWPDQIVDEGYTAALAAVFAGYVERDGDEAEYYSLGDVVAVPEGTENPYKCSELFDERPALMGKFLRGIETPGVEFWHAPACGGAVKLASGIDAVRPDIVDYYWTAGGTPKRRSGVIVGE